jgi:hypothetical protein
VEEPKLAKKSKEQRKRDKQLRLDREKRMQAFGEQIGYYTENPDYDPEAESGYEAAPQVMNKSALKKYGAESIEELFDRMERRAIQAGQAAQEQLGQVEGGQGTAARTTRQRFQLPVIGGGSAPQFFGDTAISRTGFRL